MTRNFIILQLNLKCPVRKLLSVMTELSFQRKIKIKIKRERGHKEKPRGTVQKKIWGGRGEGRSI